MSDDTDTGVSVSVTASDTSDNWQQLSRAFFLFDTSSISDVATKNSATFSVIATAKQTGITSSIRLVKSTVASTTVLASSDYQGTVGNTESQATSDVSISSIDTSGSTYTDWTLNATGTNHINLTGVTNFGLRLSHDADNSAPTWVAPPPNKRAEVSLLTSETSGTSQDPKLVVVYTLPAGQVRKINSQSIINSTTLTNDNALGLLLSANKTYIVEGVIFATSTSNSPDIKIGFTVPTGATMDIGYLAGNDTVFAGSGLLESNSEESGSIRIDANTESVIKISGTVVTGGTAGNLQFKWSQATSNASPTSVAAGSYLIVTEI